ncbi:oxidoreductase [Limnobacter alexandrii]|uniref:oxidoreductase n=1 Tax=Limnobacter alexandrii TaxID=2570352 RepID=UPI001109F2D2|nr:oxidoreductase [Limnobacter alexandrii]
MNKNKKPVALVTGASSGIGLVTAQKLVAAGYRVFGTSRHPGADMQHSFEMLPLDVDKDESVAALVNQIIDSTGRIDLLVNNAGRGLSPAGAEEFSLEQAQAIFNTNFFGVVRTTNAVLPHMRSQQSGRIINIGSVLGFLPMPYMAFYAASKYALKGYSESLDHELRTMGIRVSVIEPAFMKTAIEANSTQAEFPMDEYQDIRIELQQRLARMVDTAENPSVVADAILKAAQEPKPRLAYTAGTAAARLKMMSNVLPSRFLDAGIRKNLGLRTR